MTAPPTNWFTGLSARLNAEMPAPDGVWTALKQRCNPLERCPHPNSNVFVRKLEDRHGAYFVFKNTQSKTYLRLSEAEYRLWQRMDGKTTVQDLIVEHYMETGAFAHATVLHLVEQLHNAHMLVEEPVEVWKKMGSAIQNRTWFSRIAAPAKFLLTQQFSIRGIDPMIEALYRNGGWLCFTRPAQVLFLLVSVVGLFAYSEVVGTGQHTFVGQDLVGGLAWLWVAAILPVVIHELGHALTVKHYGREVPRGGLMLYFGMPAAFVETTDIWLEPRRARLAVTWNGPYTGLIIGGAAALFMFFFPGSLANSLLFRMAGIAYATVFLNVNPLLKFDGYYLLADALSISSLRARSLTFVRHKLIRHLAKRQKLKPEEWVYTSYGLLTILWMGWAIYLSIFFWQTRVQEGLQALLGEGYGIVARIMGFLLVAAMMSLLVLILLVLLRLGQGLWAQFVQRGGLARHGQLAWVGGGTALALGIMGKRFFPQYAPLVGLILAWFVGGRLIAFTRPYFPARRAVGYLSFALALFIGGAGQLFLLIPVPAVLGTSLDWGVAAALVGAGILVAVQLPLRDRGLILLALGAGIVGGLVLWFGMGIALDDPHFWGAVVLIATGAWSFGELRGGARSPAMLLLFGGGAMQMAGYSFIGMLLVVAGGLHLIVARLPKLTVYEMREVSITQEAIKRSVSGMVRRMIAQVYFETGWRGVTRLGEAFSSAMQAQGVNLAIRGNEFEDKELSKRKGDELTVVYGTAFDVLYGLLRQELGKEGGRLAFVHGLDMLPWQNREVMAEMVLSRRAWGSALKQEVVDERLRRRSLLKRVPLFVALSDDDLDQISARLGTVDFAARETILRQGDTGDTFFVVEKGKVSIWQTGADGEPSRIADRGAGQYFGEAALVSEQPRNATIRAETPVRLLTLARADFDRLVRHHISLGENLNYGVGYSWLLRGMPIFDELESHELDWLAVQMETEQFDAGEVVFREGEAGEKFYIVESGHVIVTREADDQVVELSRRGPGEYIGEIALLEKCPRTATITAETDVTLLSLDGEHFLDLVAGYARLGEEVERTGSRRMSFVRMSTGELL